MNTILGGEKKWKAKVIGEEKTQQIKVPVAAAAAAEIAEIVVVVTVVVTVAQLRNPPNGRRTIEIIVIINSKRLPLIRILVTLLLRYVLGG